MDEFQNNSVEIKIRQKIHTIEFHLYNILKHLNQTVTESRFNRGETGWKPDKRVQKHFWGDDEADYFDCDDGFRGIYKHQNL